MTSASAPSATVLVYSDDAAVRERIRMAVGRRPAGDVPTITWVEASTGEAVVELVDAGGIDLLLLDGEAWPTGGMGIAKQLKNEIEDCPLICLVLARKVDRWLATWAQADAELSHPLDPVAAAATVADLLRRRLGALPAASPAR
jgi:DNA-binding response OmpR family regulator